MTTSLRPVCASCSQSNSILTPVSHTSKTETAAHLFDQSCLSQWTQYVYNTDTCMVCDMNITHINGAPLDDFREFLPADGEEEEVLDDSFPGECGSAGRMTEVVGEVVQDLASLDPPD